MNITTIGIDLAKNSFSLHGLDSHGKTVLRKTINRSKLLAFMAQLPSCLVGMEACSGAHYWAREFQKLGHRIGIMAPRFVAPYRKNEKNDSNDAEAICEAVELHAYDRLDSRRSVWVIHEARGISIALR